MITQTRAAFFFPKQKSSRMGMAVSIGFVTNARPPPSPPRTKKQIVINTIGSVKKFVSLEENDSFLVRITI